MRDNEKLKAMAVANLNQLIYFVDLRNKTACADLPSSGQGIDAVVQSLSEIGFDSHATSADREVWVEGVKDKDLPGDFSPLLDAMMKGKTLAFTSKGVERLLANNILTPTLNTLKNKASAIDPANFAYTSTTEDFRTR